MCGKVESTTAKKMRMPSVDRLLFRRIKIFLWILFTNNQGRFYVSAPAFALLAFLVAIADQITTYFVGILPSKFFVALGNRDAESFLRLLWESVLVVSTKALVLAASKLATSLFYLKCREICNRTLHRLYFHKLIFYKLNLAGKSDNPDQRMTQDIEKLTRISIQDMFSPVIMAPFIICYYTYLTVNSAGWLGAAGIYAYFLISTIVNKFLLSPIVRLGVEQEKEEGNFRAKHLDVLSNSEAIAFYNSGQTENKLTNDKLESLLKVQKKLTFWRSFLCLMTNFFDYYGGTLSYLIIAVPTFLTKKYDSYTGVQLTGIVSKSAFIYLYLIYSFSRVVALAELFGEMSAVAHRVVGLYEELQDLEKRSDDQYFKGDYIAIEMDTYNEKIAGYTGKEGDSVAKYEDKKFNAPDESECLLQAEIRNSHKRIPEISAFCELNVVDVAKITDSSLLIKELTLKIISGQKILITGESGTGKTSLLRVVAGIWLPKSGTVSWHLSRRVEDVIFLPQDPYFPNGHTSLAQQLIYPLKAEEIPYDEAVLRQLLRDVGMESILERFALVNEPFDGNWNAVLSKGEMQRLCIARLLYHKPKLAFFDESTSAVGKELESRLYQMIAQSCLTFISIGHQENLRQFHQYELHLDESGGWTFIKLPTIL